MGKVRFYQTALLTVEHSEISEIERSLGQLQGLCSPQTV